MILKDRKLLGRLIALQGWSIRALAAASGFKSHGYLSRLVRGKANTLTAERAVAMCANLQVPVDTLFLTKMSSDPQHSSGKSFRPGTTGGGRTTTAGTTNRGPRRTAAVASAVKSA